VAFEVVPRKLVYGGEALGHYQGRTVLVPRALPGERLEVEEVRTARGVVRARPLRVLAAAPERVEAPCPYFGRCGGCHYQHFDAKLQPIAKREILRETLRRLGRISWDSEIPIHTAQPWNYRNQAEFKVQRHAGGGVSLGFFGSESHRVVDLDACLILSPCLNAVLAALRAPQWSARLGACREIELLADDRDEEVMLTLRGALGTERGKVLAQDCLAGLPGVVSVAIDEEDRRAPQVWGKAALVYTVKEFQYQVSPGCFFQASRFLLPELVDAVTGETAGSLALDLFAGVGLFTLPLAQRFATVMGVETSARAVADLAANARTLGLTNVRAVRQTVYDFLRRFAQTSPDLIVLDPPRGGVGARTLELLAALRPKRVHCVSCSPPTLARDLGFLQARGYHLESIELFDLFPQTYHMESVARLVGRPTNLSSFSCRTCTPSAPNP
jgi:23S rRNA (uracil1939-C5)-methyltransferase